eukprot:5979095-Pyramimonas_sp.AAC.1
MLRCPHHRSVAGVAPVHPNGAPPAVLQGPVRAQVVGMPRAVCLPGALLFFSLESSMASAL